MDDRFPRVVRSQDAEMVGTATGRTRRCQLTGCTGVQYRVVWEDGSTSWPCSKGLVTDPDGTWRIG